ncbi:MAG: hydrolase [Bacteroidetes bacterium]|nr:hydrolase [Bacteroidota bacterium]
MNKIKVYFNEHHLLITSDEAIDRAPYGWIIDTDDDAFAFRMEPRELFDEKYDKNILIITAHVEETLESIFDYSKAVVAAGGIVKNERDETLIIFRRGYWDMAKGKVEKGEKIINAAQREVEEETGVKIESLSEEVVITYHCYRLKGKDCIKETHWYHMRARDGQDELAPQAEEDIEQALWADKEKIRSLKGKFYPLIWALLVQEAGI